eukprot:CAMPEP_0114420058 /NCGR_PEP_ID=MMETSP0103-20121206/4358_1 /TAXON_ID=37642 ORGANISM="Paraphysomonas imperforata, Strain PA2" /NCGR_SAMPLE_ID=MMETSP0103 /ASSEMBLY_ACC=CAM_ASM_000201 /LENGTH=407 /DNA_ID=CAMNT_0001588519 /DNA_START=1 /DNA_END=1225 /DNA_ORIENTATION=+
MEKTLGRRAKQTATYCLVVILFLVIVAYLILLRDVASELFEYFTPDDYEVTVLTKNMILTSLAVLAFPLMTADSLHALRYASYLGATCILLLLGCLCMKAHQQQAAGLTSPLKYTPTSVSDVLTALPITFIGFLCHFNVNSIFCDLTDPRDIKCVVRSTVSGVAAVFLLFGFAGYVFAGAATADNVLKNFSAKDPVLMLARVGLSVTLMSQLPIMVIPCRKTVYPLLWPETNQLAVTQRRRAMSHDVLVRRLSSPRDQDHTKDALRGRASKQLYPASAGLLLVARRAQLALVLATAGGGGAGLRGAAGWLNCAIRTHSDDLGAHAAHRAVASWRVRGVDSGGSTLTIIICFLLPGAAYLTTWRQLGDDRQLSVEVVGCCAMLGLGLLFMLLCTPQALHNAISPPGPA